MKLEQVKEAFCAAGVDHAAPKAITIIKKKKTILVPKPKKGKEKEAKDKVEKVMKEYKDGTLRSGSKTGPKVKDRKQAIAIALSESEKKSSAPPYTQVISAEERGAAIRTGMILKMAEIGIDPARMDEMAKTAVVGEGLDLGAKAIVIGSLATGIPVGIMAHMMHTKIKETKRKERELQSKIDYYSTAGQELESGLSRAGATI